ncbi:MAG: hypothetical protein RIS29_779 [Bacteroidota bacterium]|jgi:hypothetical protein
MKKIIIYLLILIACLSCTKVDKATVVKSEEIHIPSSILKMETQHTLKAEKTIPQPFFKAEYLRELTLIYSDENYLLVKYHTGNLAKIRLLYDKQNELWIVLRTNNNIEEYKIYPRFYVLNKDFIPLFSGSPFENRMWIQIFRYRYNPQLIDCISVRLLDNFVTNEEDYTLKDIYTVYYKLKAKKFKKTSGWSEMCKITDESPVWEF